jgi:hypothetical protein
VQGLETAERRGGKRNGRMGGWRLEEGRRKEEYGKKRTFYLVGRQKSLRRGVLASQCTSIQLRIFFDLHSHIFRLHTYVCEKKHQNVRNLKYATRINVEISKLGLSIPGFAAYSDCWMLKICPSDSMIKSSVLSLRETWVAAGSPFKNIKILKKAAHAKILKYLKVICKWGIVLCK